MTQVAKPERGNKVTCQSCASRFYDLARTPVICPKCGADYVEPVRPPSAYQRKRGSFMKSVPMGPIEPDGGEHSAAEENSHDEDDEAGEEREKELDGEVEHEPETEETPE